MKIRPYENNTDSKGYCQSFKGVPPNPKYIPEIIGKVGKVAGEYINTPEQKLFMALSALAIQPLIDLKYAQDDQKVDSAIKTASKAMAGGLTGVTIRAVFLKITDYYIGFQKHNRLNRYFYPDSATMLKEMRPEIADLRMSQYQKTLGTLFAVLFMILFSNSNLDVPLTSDFQDIISGVVKENKNWVDSISDVMTSRKNKIINWFKQRKNTIINIKNKTRQIIDILRKKPEDQPIKKESKQ